MKNTFALLVTLILWLECHAQNATKNYWEFGYQVYGLPVPDMDTPLGIILKAGYDIVPYKKKLIVSVQFYIGGGLFAQTNSQGITDYDFNYKYNILARTRKS